MKVLFDKEKVSAAINGTSLQGYLNVDYKTLVSHFGVPVVIYPTDPQDPEYTDGKVQALWVIKTKKNKIVTIYDYKEYDTPKELVTCWHFGAQARNDLLELISELDQNERLKSLVSRIQFSF